MHPLPAFAPSALDPHGLADFRTGSSHRRIHEALITLDERLQLETCSYKLVEWLNGERMVVDRFDLCWGKSALVRVMARLLAPSEGEPLQQGRRLQELGADARRQARVAMQMDFHCPFASPNPRLCVADRVGEAPVVHGIVSRAERDEGWPSSCAA